jgi:hypothetical protein
MALAMALVACAAAFGQGPPDPEPLLDVGYTLSGRTYVTTAVGFGEQPIGKGLTWDYGLIVAIDTETRRPGGGLGAWLRWQDHRSPLTARVGLYGIAQGGRPADIGIGISVGARL